MHSPDTTDSATEQTVSRLLDENKRLRDRVYLLEQRCEELYWNYTTRPQRWSDRGKAYVRLTVARMKRVIKFVLRINGDRR